MSFLQVANQSFPQARRETSHFARRRRSIPCKTRFLPRITLVDDSFPKTPNGGKMSMLFGRVKSILKGNPEPTLTDEQNLALKSMTGVPSIEDLKEILSSSGYGKPVFRLSQTNERLFGSENEPRLIFYRDNSSWCPYCHRVWLQLEEKKVPYKVEKVNMRCYGPKPEWYTRMVPSGLLPAVKIDGQLITESMDIMFAIESTFTDYTPLLPPRDSPQFTEVPNLLRLERKFFGMWLRLITTPGNNLTMFKNTLNDTNTALLKFEGPFFLGKEFSIVDAIWAPFLERAAASVPYWKGLTVRGTGQWPAVDAWFDAMDALPSFQAMKSDDFTVTHCLEPQIGQCYPSPEGKPYRDLVDGLTDSWQLPLQPQTTAWGFDDGAGGGGAREEAALSLVSNHDAVVGFCLRGLRNGDQFRDAVGVGLRLVALALLKGTEEVGTLPRGLPLQVALAAEYLRDRVGVPRDLGYPAARQLRAHLNWLIREIGA